MKCMKVIAVIAAVALESALASESNAISDVRSALAAAVNGLQPKRSGVCKYMQEVGFRNRGSAEYESLAIVVSNHFETVVSNFCICATNDLERMVLMSAGWFCDDDYYLRWYSSLVDLAVDGVVSSAEIKWYGEGSGDERRMNILALKYDSPGVSNLVRKLQGITGDTNYCQRILSGEARRLYLQYRTEIECEGDLR